MRDAGRQKAFTSGCRRSGRIFANQERSEEDREKFAPTKQEPAMAGEFPLHLSILTQSGSQLPREAAVLPWPVMVPDSPVLPSSEAGGDRLSPSPIPGHHTGSQVGSDPWADSVSWHQGGIS